MNDLKPFGYPVNWIKDAELLEIPERARHLLEDYSGISSTELMSHINEVVSKAPMLRDRDRAVILTFAKRAKALELYPYPCLGHYRFLDIQTVRSSAYSEILSRIIHGATFLDLGCCIGQELRQLASDGAPPSSLYGADICPEFFDVGYALFRDKSIFGGRLLQADIFDKNLRLGALVGDIDIIWTASLIHLWGWNKQREALSAMFSLVERAPNPLIAGRFMGFTEPGDYVFESKGIDESFYRHNAHSFRKLFTEASERFPGWELEVEAPAWQETLNIRTKDEPGRTWNVQVKFIARRKCN